MVKVVGSWWITESVCAYITGREKGFDFETYCLREERWAWQDMDPGRYALHQGWDNNSVIVVSSLNNSPIWNMGIIIQRNYY